MPALLSTLGCGSNPQGTPEVAVSPDDDSGVRLTLARTTLSIQDYQGVYKLLGNQYTDLNDVSASITADAWANVGYTHIQESGVVLSLFVEPTGEIDPDLGLPIFQFKQEVTVPSLECSIAADGEAYPYMLPEWESPTYQMRGTFWLDCLGDELTFEASHWYNEPGELVGQIAGYFEYEVVDEPAGSN